MLHSVCIDWKQEHCKQHGGYQAGNPGLNNPAWSLLYDCGLGYLKEQPVLLIHGGSFTWIPLKVLERKHLMIKKQNKTVSAHPIPTPTATESSTSHLSEKEKYYLALGVGFERGLAP